MNIFVVFAIGQLLLTLARGSEVENEPKRVVCYHFSLSYASERSISLEDINATLCTHLVYLKAKVNEETEDVYLQPVYDTHNSSIEGYTENVLKLKEVNPKLKLLLYIASDTIKWASKIPSRRSNVIKRIVELLKLTRFDGLDFLGMMKSRYEENVADFLCETQSEFDKHGFIVSTMLSDIELSKERDSTIGKISRCSEFITLRTIEFWDPPENTTRLVAPITFISSEVDKYLELGFPANKLVVGIPAFGILATLTNSNQNGFGAGISGPVINATDGYFIFYNELMKKMNDPTEDWTIRRDEATNAPYAYSKEGLWASYDDTSSVATKAQYILMKNLGGAYIFAMEMDDFEGIGGEGKFPLTRAIHDTFNRRQQADNSTSIA